MRTYVHGFLPTSIIAPRRCRKVVASDATTFRGLHGTTLIVTKHTPRLVHRWVRLETATAAIECGADEVVLTAHGWVRVHKLHAGDELVVSPVNTKIWAQKSINLSQRDKRVLHVEPWVHVCAGKTRRLVSFLLTKQRPQPLIQIRGRADAFIVNGFVFRANPGE